MDSNNGVQNPDTERLNDNFQSGDIWVTMISHNAWIPKWRTAQHKCMMTHHSMIKRLVSLLCALYRGFSWSRLKQAGQNDTPWVGLLPRNEDTWLIMHAPVQRESNTDSPWHKYRGFCSPVSHGMNGGDRCLRGEVLKLFLRVHQNTEVRICNSRLGFHMWVISDSRALVPALG